MVINDKLTDPWYLSMIVYDIWYQLLLWDYSITIIMGLSYYGIIIMYHDILVGGLEHFLFSPSDWDDDPIWRAYFSGG